MLLLFIYNLMFTLKKNYFIFFGFVVNNLQGILRDKKMKFKMDKSPMMIIKIIISVGRTNYWLKSFDTAYLEPTNRLT